jgi:xylulokinase
MMISTASSYMVGSDLGTSGCKSVVIDSTGRVCGWAREDYPTLRPQPGWAEQNPRDWYSAFCRSVRQALLNASVEARQIAMVAIVGVTHNAVLLDDNNRVLRPSIIYTDNRSQVESKALQGRWGDEIFKRTVNKMGPLWTWPQLEWVKSHEPEIWKAVRRILFQKDYVRWLLTGDMATDPIDAAGTLLYDPVNSEWIDDFCGELGISPDILPELRPPLALAGRVLTERSEESGLAAGTPVITGTTDTAAEVFGAGAVRVGQATVKLATVGRITVVNPGPFPNPAFLNYPHILENLWYPGTATKYAASAYTWARETFWKDGDSLPEYSIVDDEAGRAPAGAGGLLFHPHLDGEFAPHWDPDLRGSFVGVSIHHRRPHFTRAVLEGVGFAIRQAFDDISGLGINFGEIRLIGGGARSDLWAQIMADILNREILIPQNADAAYGAGLMAGITAGFINPTPSALEETISLRTCLSPNPEITGLYNELFQIYLMAGKMLAPISYSLQKYQAAYWK